jgi:hypothetical protein
MNSSSPPRPRLALAVGIVGHRPNRLPDDPAKLASIAKEIGIVLDAIGRQANTLKDRYRAYFADEPPLISVVSALAEGSDRIAAWAAIARGPAAAAAAHDAVFVLDAPLPFAAATYSDDFKSAASKAEFEDLRNRARAVLALPGERGAPQDKAYETVGVTVLNQADILLAVWDGGISAGRGGTTEMLDLAAQLGIPVIHIDAEAEAATRICWDGLSEPAASSSAFADLPCAGVATALPGLLDIMLRPPAEKPGPHGPRTFLQPPMRTERDWLLHYQQERLRRWNWYFTFTALRAVFGGCPLSQSKTDWRPSTSETLAAELAGFDVSLPPASRLQAQSILGRAYGWADAVGVRFGQVFRSAFVTNFVLAAFAVVAAALSLVWHDPGELLKMGPDIAPEAIAHHKLPFVAI